MRVKIIITRKKILTILLLMLISCIVAMEMINLIIKNDMVPLGIISFEFVGSISNANRLFEIWGSNGKIAASFSIGLDYLFLICYVVFGYLLLVIQAERFSSYNVIVSKLFYAMTKFLLVAGILDGIENFGLLSVLLGTANEFWPQLSYWSALIKFFIVGVVIVALIVGQLVYVVARKKFA